MKTLQRISLPLLTLYALAVLAIGVVNWQALALVQKVAVILTVIAACHEWEETKFPGGFFEYMAGIMGVSTEGVYTPALYAKPDVLIFLLTGLALCFPQMPFFTCSVLLLGLFEGVVHVMGIKLGKPEKPYTPGLVTAELFALTSVVSIVLLARSGAVTGWSFLAGLAWLLPCFVVMELRVWNEVGMKPKDLIQTYRKVLSKKS